MTPFGLILTITTLASSFSDVNPDSIYHAISDYSITEGGYFNVVYRYDQGIDSIKWNLDPDNWSYSILFYDSVGVITSQKISDKHVVCYVYSLFPKKAGKFIVPNAILWSSGNENELNFSDTLTVYEKVESAAEQPKNLFGKPFSDGFKNSIKLEFNCAPHQTCTKAFFNDTSFTIGDTITLIIGSNKSTALYQIPKIKHLKYLTHYTSKSTTVKDGKITQTSYITIKYRLEKTLKKIKTPNFKAKIGARTQHIKGLKLKAPKS